MITHLPLHHWNTCHGQLVKRNIPHDRQNARNSTTSCPHRVDKLYFLNEEGEPNRMPIELRIYLSQLNDNIH